MGNTTIPDDGYSAQREAFEATFKYSDHAKYKDGEIIAGRVRYAEPVIDKMFSAWLQSAKHAAQSTPPAQPTADAVESRAILVAAQYWWAKNMPDSHYVSAQIKGDGRVDVHWRDSDESGKYTLPVDFLDALPTTMSGDYVMVPNLLAAFRTTVSDDGKYEMVFRFKSMEAMHAADDEWRRLSLRLSASPTGGE